MKKVFRYFVLFILSLFFVPIVFSQESLTITTYYPAPIGIYSELRSQRMAVGDNYLDSTQTCWPPNICANQIGADADLVVEGNVGIGTVTPQAALDVNSTTSGFVPPRMTELQRDSISGPPAGSIIYNTDDNELNYYNGSSWKTLGAGEQIWERSGNNVYLIDNEWRVGIGTNNPQSKLHVNGTIILNEINTAGNDLRLGANSNYRITIDTGGAVYIDGRELYLPNLLSSSGGHDTNVNGSKNRLGY